jgi:hypothetical protein
VKTCIHTSVRQTIVKMTASIPSGILVLTHHVQYHGMMSLINAVYFDTGARGGAVVEALRYKPEGSGIDSR